jgi:hypothetical protein
MFNSDIRLDYIRPNENVLEKLVFPQNVDLDRRHTEATGPRLPAREVLFDCVAADPQELYGSILNIDPEKSGELSLNGSGKNLGSGNFEDSISLSLNRVVVPADDPRWYLESGTAANNIVSFSRTPLPALQL